MALEALQQLLGHATIDMAMRDARLSPYVKSDAVQLLDLKAPAARFDSAPLRGPTLTATGNGSEPAAITAEPAPQGQTRGTREQKGRPPDEAGGWMEREKGFEVCPTVKPN